MDAALQFEYRIFRTRDPNAEIELRYGFGWRLQSHSASDFATGGTFAGATYAGDHAGVVAGGMRLRTDHWVNLQMVRDRAIPGYDRLVQCEEDYLAARDPRPPVRVSRIIAGGFFLWVTGLLAILSFVPPLDAKVEEWTAGLGEGSLTVAALVSIPLILAAGYAAALPFRPADIRRQRRWEETMSQAQARRTHAWTTAQQILASS